MRKKWKKTKNRSGFIVKQYFINLRIASTFFSLLQTNKKMQNKKNYEQQKKNHYSKYDKRSLFCYFLSERCQIV